MKPLQWQDASLSDHMLFRAIGDLGLGERRARLFVAACFRETGSWSGIPLGPIVNNAIALAEAYADGHVNDSLLSMARSAFCLATDSASTLIPTQAIDQLLSPWSNGDAIRRGLTQCAQHGLDAAVGAQFPLTDGPAVSHQTGMLRQRQRQFLRRNWADRLRELCPAWQFGRQQPDAYVADGVVAKAAGMDRVASELLLTAYRQRNAGDVHLCPQRLSVAADALEELGQPDGLLLRHLRGLEPCCGRLGWRVADACVADCRCHASAHPGWQPTPPHIRGCWALEHALVALVAGWPVSTLPLPFAPFVG